MAECGDESVIVWAAKATKRLVLLCGFAAINAASYALHPRVAALMTVVGAFYLFLKGVTRMPMLVLPVVCAAAFCLTLGLDLACAVAVHLVFYTAVWIKHHYMYMYRFRGG